ncbi:alcohol dehydrogenase catalytic domain-containing protein [Bifidobacterium pseudolongum]|uniref:Alcohol dehydrogenase n=1 Tax=Bifidobacterium pseudolongum subsp. pseudolongum TaxID=31954 RepID=A0A4Q5AA64_9BIFI|nr:zinc-binding dehydrogenase [Bifidobacterium pseudolongum]PKV08943.1 alcohol dehydrogenase [Bifidobacterium pseudolongum subsp. pseudolongum]RYQ21992.1 alcohol dehydrogenase [Bifidobacterium pseudolongum subsp. pseudolongum]RYQ52191.1 alcohol dehydrogenase [Bifidobacterium pseudolongum subsp. pseudolongum]RYQ54100.1 alcohol dehydrogenase [Bifidobacterium pseudolongum subsp. pseudolongum]
MKAYVIPNAEARGLDAMELADVPRPQAAPGHVLIQVHAAGLNPVDYKLAEGGNANWTYPHILGLDVAGEIVELGEGVEDTWKVGMRVAGHGDLRFDGCFAEYVSAPTYELALIPDDVEYTTAAGMLCSALTAYQTINRKPNLNLVRTALVHGGSGAVGGVAVQLAKMHGITVFTTCSTRNVDYVREHVRPDAVIDYRTQDVDERVRELTDGRGADLIVDTVSGEEAECDLGRLAYNGQLVTIVDVPPVSSGQMFGGALSIDVVNLGGAHGSGNPMEQRDLGTMASDVLSMVSQGQLDPLITGVLPFGDLVEGLRSLADHKVTGKLVVDVDA